jgi:hypothetical protein
MLWLLQVWDGVYCHETIKEEGRQDGFQIGDRLIIDGEPYDDLACHWPRFYP